MLTGGIPPRLHTKISSSWTSLKRDHFLLQVYGESSVGLADGNEEHHPLEPTNPYAATKAGAEMLVKAYHTSYKLPVITTRGNNVYGPQQYPEKLIPKFVLLAKQGRNLPVHGNGNNTRSYL